MGFFDFLKKKDFEEAKADYKSSDDSMIKVMGKFLVNGSVYLEDWAPIEKFYSIAAILKSDFFADISRNFRDIDETLRFIEQYIGKKINNDNRTMDIGGGLVTVNYGKFVVVFNAKDQSFYINIVIPNKNQAIKFREKELPKNEDIPYGVFFWIWINEDEMVCRDRAGDYFDRY